MKNLKLKLSVLALTAIFTLSLSSAFASDTLRINQYLKSDYSIVSVFNTSDSNLKLQIFDNNGDIYYSQTIDAATSSQKLFDLSNLEDGNYSLVLVGKNSRVEEAFQVVAQKQFVSDYSMELAENRIKSSSYANRK